MTTDAIAAAIQGAPDSATAHSAMAAPAASGAPTVVRTATPPSSRPVRGAASATSSAAPLTAAIAAPSAPYRGINTTLRTTFGTSATSAGTVYTPGRPRVTSTV